MLKTLALILAGGASPGLSVLAGERSDAAIPFAGKFRIVDFTLSNCVNSGIYNVSVLTQHRPMRLHTHLGAGRPWDLDRAQGGLHVLHPSPTQEGGGWQRGTADAVRYYLDFISDQPGELVLILGGDHIYKMDYRPLLSLHTERKADVTLAVHSVSPHEAYRYGIVSVDANGNVGSFVEKPRRTTSSLASMGIYVFNKQFLIDTLNNSNDASFGRDLLPRLISTSNVQAYNFQGYWVDIGTVQTYHEANMALLAETPALDMYDPEWVIHTTSAQRPGVEIYESAEIESSLLSDGCRVQGTVQRSIISPGVFVSPGAIIRDSIVLHDAWIGPGAVVDRCIIDTDVHIGAEAVVGEGDENPPNIQEPTRLNTGLTLVGERAQIPAGARLGRNVVIRTRVGEAAFGHNKVVPSGTTL